MYSINPHGQVVRESDGAIIPEDTANSDWCQYVEWREGGGSAPLIPVDPLPLSVMQAQLTSFVQGVMDVEARTRGYDSIMSLCTYATSTNPKFQAEGQAGVVWRDACWALGYQLVDEVKAGSRQIPTEAELLALLPAMVWPPA